MSLLRDMFSNAPELLAVLEDVNVRFVNISPAGKFEYSKLGRQRTGTEQVPRAVLHSLSEALDTRGGEVIDGEWVVRLFKGVDWGQGLGNILVERVPIAVVDRLTHPVLQALRASIKREGNGVILGPAGASKSSILLWLASQLSEEPLLLVSENPPSELPGGHITHVFPPGSLYETRRLERLIRIYPNVLWDRASSVEDIRTLFGFGQGKRRWLSMDIATREHSSALWEAAEVSGLRQSIDLLLALSVSVIGRPEVVVLGQRRDGVWSHVTGEGAEKWLHPDSKKFSQTVPETQLEEVSDTPPSLEERSAGAGIRRRKGHPTSDFDNPLTIPVESMEEISSADDAGPDQQTGLIDSEHLPALAKPLVAEVTRQYPRSYDPPEVTAESEPPEKGPRPFKRDAATSSASNDLLERIMPMLRDEPMPEFNLDDLRITMHEEVAPEDLDTSRDVDTRSQIVHDVFPEEDDEIEFDDDQSDYSSVSEVYQDDLAFILTEDDISTSVASATDYALGDWGTSNFVPDPETSPTGRFTEQIPKSIRAEEGEDATDEVNLSDKLRMIRERFQRKD